MTPGGLDDDASDSHPGGILQFLDLRISCGESPDPGPGAARSDRWGGVELRVLPIGDSITWGAQSSDENGYRSHLFNSLQSRGNDVDFVGAMTSGTMADNQHEGYRGPTIDQIEDLSSLGVYAAPDIVLLHAGTRGNGHDHHHVVPQPDSDPIEIPYTYVQDGKTKTTSRSLILPPWPKITQGPPEDWDNETSIPTGGSDIIPTSFPSVTFPPPPDRGPRPTLTGSELPRPTDWDDVPIIIKPTDRKPETPEPTDPDDDD
ncbi:hypothetical protein BJX65DRAFT_315088 [Aspergillus insuetus]